jgi:hypothetical protein
MPAGIETDEADIAGILEGAHGAARRHKTHRGDGPLPEARELWIDREFRRLRLNRVLDQHVDQALAPEQLGVIGQACPGDMRERLVVRRKRLVGGERGAHGDDPRPAERRVAFIKLKIVDNPNGGGVVKHGVGAADVEPIGSPQRGFDVAHRLERRTHEQPQPLPFGLDECLDGDIVRDVVRRGARRHAQRQTGHNQGQNRTLLHAAYCILPAGGTSPVSTSNVEPSNF